MIAPAHWPPRDMDRWCEPDGTVLVCDANATGDVFRTAVGAYPLGPVEAVAQKYGPLELRYRPLPIELAS